MVVANYGRRLRVLIVDDYRDHADILSAFRLHGYDTDVAYSAITALQAAADFKPQVALLDLGMPEFDGYCLAREFRRTTGLERIRLIAVTGYVNGDHRDRAAEAGFDDFVAKPYAIDELNQAIHGHRDGYNGHERSEA